MKRPGFRTEATLTAATIKAGASHSYDYNTGPTNALIVTFQITLRQPRAPKTFADWVESWEGGHATQATASKDALIALKLPKGQKPSPEQQDAINEPAHAALQHDYAAYREQAASQNRNAGQHAQKAALLLALLNQPVIITVEPPSTGMDELFTFLADAPRALEPGDEIEAGQ